jgi:hypothetical protein
MTGTITSIGDELARVFSHQSRAFTTLSNGLEVRGKGMAPNREFMARIDENALEVPGGNQLAGLARVLGFEDWIVFRLISVAVSWVVEITPGQALTPEQIIEARGMAGKVVQGGLRPSVIAPGPIDLNAEAERILAALMARARHLTPHGQEMRRAYLRGLSLVPLQYEAMTFMRGIVADELNLNRVKLEAAA